MTKKDYLLNFIEKLMMTGQWANEVNDQLLRSRMVEWREMKKGKGKGGGIGSAFASGAKALGGIVAEGVKEGGKALVAEGVKAGIMSIV